MAMIGLILVGASIINTFIIAMLIFFKKTNIAIGLATIQAILWMLKLLGYF